RNRRPRACAGLTRARCGLPVRSQRGESGNTALEGAVALVSLEPDAAVCAAGCAAPGECACQAAEPDRAFPVRPQARPETTGNPVGNTGRLTSGKQAGAGRGVWGAGYV